MTKFLASGVRDRVFPGGAWAVGGQDWVETGFAGRFRYEADSSEVTAATRYDLASLTKVIATTSVTMLLSEQGELDMLSPVSKYLPTFLGPGKADVRITHLLRHCAGFRATMPLWQLCKNQEDAKQRILSAPLDYVPETETVYSCLGFLVLHQILLKILGDERAFTEYLQSEALAPLGLTSTGFCPADPAECAPTEGDLQGVVHDENARFLGGVSGNAGLFGTCADVARFCQAMLRGGEGVFAERTLRSWTQRQSSAFTRAFGYDTNAEPCSAGTLMANTAYGHTGFTGTTLWVDPERGMFFVLLTNRVHPTRDNMKITEFRRAYHDEAIRQAEG